MAEKHPDELELLSFVEEELDDPARREMAEHLVACRTCADQIRRLQAGRGALQAAPLLELPDARRAEIFAALPERADRWRVFRPVKRALVIAAPVAAAATVLVALIIGGMQLDLGGGDDGAGDAAGGDEGAADTRVMQADTGETEATPQSLDDATVVRRVQGPAAEVMRVLESEGIPAEIASPVAVVADALPGDVRAALSGRPRGNVTVYVR
jgi:anti-sigma factor RsiW